jgi:hypothetical protein
VGVWRWHAAREARGFTQVQLAFAVEEGVRTVSAL